MTPATTGDVAAAKDTCAAEVARRSGTILHLSHEIHADPELSWHEHRAARRVADVLIEAGFAVETGVYGVATAVEAVHGDGDLTVAICAEYDALPGIGHACGHNMIAAAAVGAAMALMPVAERAGLRVKLLGTPAEEHGGGKVAMLTAGAWEDVDLSLMVHGTGGTDGHADAFDSTAVDRFEVTFTGRAAHAAGSPERGVNAGAAATLALTALAFLRQHIPAGSSVNGIISLGGEATNIVPDRTVLQAEVRAADLDVWRDLRRRVLACFEGAAIATGCEWSHAPTEHPYAPIRHDERLVPLWDANLIRRGRRIDDDKRIRGASTDMGNVSQVVPAIHPTIAILGSRSAPHHPDFAVDARSTAADDAVLDAATVLAWTVVDAALTPSVRASLQRERTRRPPGATRVTLTS